MDLLENYHLATYTRSSTLNPRSFGMYKHTSFDNFKMSPTMNHLTSVSALFSSYTILRFSLSFGYQTNMALACLLNVFGIAE